MPCDSTIGVSTFLGGRTPTKELVGPAYDEVYEQIADTYLEPNSVKARQSTSTLNTDVESARLLPSSGNLASSSQSIPVKQRTTVIDDVARPLSFDEGQKDNLQLHRTREKMIMEEITRKELFKKKPIPPAKPPTPIKPPPKPTALSIRDFGIDMSKQTTGSCQQISSRVDFPTTSSVPTSSTNVARPSSRIFESSDRLDVLRGRPAPPTTYSHQPSGSITNLSFRGLGDPAAHIFDRPESVDFGTSSPSTSTQGAPEDVNGPRRPFTSLSQHAILNRRFLNVLPDEVDRSVGSSTLLENDVRDSPSSYLRDAELRLNMFVNDKMAPPSSNGSTTGGQDETTV
ncbi:unnamed protein product [Caenorhabditis auriculariae]|uniref:Uncharacterized protein n=1 Tax=Caenorhabditis auriculariae TaxID=2777116 RepID=A0A8S1H629_9PELO|nr:unnamed protein product [Caenorhabditis auriculariae]